jgi:hypothetical protein
VKERAVAATTAALAACVGVLCGGVPLLPLQALVAIGVAAALGWFGARSSSAGAASCIAFAAAIAQHLSGDWKTVVAILLGALVATRWYAAAILVATLIFLLA